MTRDYALILPLMLTSVIAYGVARRLHPESIYTEWLIRRGVGLSHGADAAVLARTTVAECVNGAPVTVPEDADLFATLALIQESRQTEFPVVSTDGDRRLAGMLHRDTVLAAAENGDHLASVVIAADLVRAHDQRVTPDDSRSEEHMSELQSHSFISYAVFCLKKKKKQHRQSQQMTLASSGPLSMCQARS